MKCVTISVIFQMAYAAANQTIQDFMGDMWTYLVYNKWAVRNICKAAKLRIKLGNAHHVVHQYLLQGMAFEYNAYNSYED